MADPPASHLDLTTWLQQGQHIIATIDEEALLLRARLHELAVIRARCIRMYPTLRKPRKDKGVKRTK